MDKPWCNLSCTGYVSDPPGVKGVETTTLEFQLDRGFRVAFPYFDLIDILFTLSASGAVPVQNVHHTIETVDCLDNLPPIYGGG